MCAAARRAAPPRRARSRGAARRAALFSPSSLFSARADAVGRRGAQASGLGAHMALPLIRKDWRPDLSEAEARKLLEDCMRVLFYRDTRACSTIQIGKVDATGSSISAPTKLDTYWEHPEFIKGGGHRGDGSW